MVFAGDVQHNGSSEEKKAEANGTLYTEDGINGDRRHQAYCEKSSPTMLSSSANSFTNLPSTQHQQVDNSFEFVVKVQSPTDKPFSKQSMGPLPITLKFEDVEYSVTIKPQTSWFEYKKWNYRNIVPNLPSLCGGQNKQARGTQKQILHGISGVVKPGEILAMLGPSGSGKTSLLNILGGRVTGDLSARKLTGQVLFNDSSFGKGMKRRTGFVMQDDVLFQHLTVKETLVYAAYLRLPTSEFSKAAKVQRAEDVITELALEKCRDTIIGGPFVRGVSGGERKRVSIGHEMLTDPSLLLLDEPTSGLDSTIALKIIHTLQDLAKGGRTIITTIHQPSSIIYHTFTKLLLLSEGHSLYYGLGSEAMNYFQSVGFAPSFATNPADFLLDLASGITYDVIDTSNHEIGAAVAAKEKNSRDQPGPGPQEVLRTLRDAYVTTLLPKTRDSINLYGALTEEESRAALERRKWPTSWIEQTSILISRGVKERRHEVFASYRIVQVAAVSIVCGLLWWQSTPEKLQDQVGLLFFITTFWTFFPMFTAIFTFPMDRQMITKERSSGMYRLSAYFVARTGGELPLELVLPTISVTIIYWMAGLKKTAAAYLAYLMITLLTVFVSQGLGQFLGAAFMEVKKATTTSSVLLLTTQLAGGYFVQATPAWISWIKYLSFNYYAYKLQLVTQYSQSQRYPCATGSCLIADYPAVRVVGLNQWGTSLMAMILMMTGFRVLAYLALRRMKLS